MTFERYIGIDYSGAQVPTAILSALRVYMAEGAAEPSEVPPPTGRKYWTRRAIAEWLAERIAEDRPALVGVDHAFSFPLAYFKAHGLPLDWPGFLEDFCRYWPTGDDYVYVDFVLEGVDGNGAARWGNRRWQRIAEVYAGMPKPVFDLNVPGSISKKTLAGLPWLLYLRRCVGSRVHFWPFDGWKPPAGRSVVAEAHPAFWNCGFPRGDRSNDQHDAYSIARWLQDADRQGTLTEFLNPPLAEHERKIAEIEGWILGLLGRSIASRWVN